MNYGRLPPYVVESVPATVVVSPVSRLVAAGQEEDEKAKERKETFNDSEKLQSV
jgi:hypothetical protein